MKRIFVLIALTLALALAPLSAQDNVDARVSVQSNQQGNIVYFSVYNTTGGTVCVFPYVIEANNVNGSVVPMIQLEAGDAGVNIGAYAQANSDYAWSVRVGAKWRAGTCA